MKKIALILMSLVMVLSMIVVPVSADDIVIGYSESLIVAKEGIDALPDIADVEGNPTASEYKVTNVKGLVAISECVNLAINYFGGTTFYLANDIDFATDTSTEDTFHPIGKDGTDCFKGTIDGQGYAIKNWEYTLAASNSITQTRGEATKTYSGVMVGLIGVGGKTSYVKNLVMDNCVLVNESGEDCWTNHGAAIMAKGNWYTFIINCKTVGGSVTSSGGVGAMAGGGGGDLKNCTNDGTTITGISAYAGGLRGWGNGQINKCVNKGNVTNTGNVSFTGGITGHGQKGIANCINYGTIVAPKDIAVIGGQQGQLAAEAGTEAYFNDNINYGLVYNSTDGKIVDKFYLGTAFGYERNYDFGLFNQLPAHSQWNAENDTVRLVTAVDSLDYDKVIFNITYGDVTKTVESDVAYTSVLAGEDEMTPADIGTAASKYLVTATISEIPENVEFTVTVSVVIGETVITCPTTVNVTNVAAAE